MMPTLPAEALPECRLSSIDGNVFNIIAAVRRALREAGRTEQAAEFLNKATACSSYDAVLALCFEYVEVT